MANLFCEVLLNADEEMGELWSFGRNPSAVRHYFAGYVALGANQNEMANQRIYAGPIGTRTHASKVLNTQLLPVPPGILVVPPAQALKFDDIANGLSTTIVSLMRTELVTTLKRQATELLSDLEREREPV